MLLCIFGDRTRESSIIFYLDKARSKFFVKHNIQVVYRSKDLKVAYLPINN
jgi:hypothetical protein